MSDPLILVVDDSQVIQTIISAALAGERCYLARARDGRSGLEAALALNPALVIVDLLMPDMDGCEMIRRLRLARGADAPAILLMTALDDMESRRGEYGADECLPKPVSPRLLRERVRELLSRRSLISCGHQRALIASSSSPAILKS